MLVSERSLPVSRQHSLPGLSVLVFVVAPLLVPATLHAQERFATPSPIYLPFVGVANPTFSTNVSSIAFSATEQAAALAYWTESRVEAAQASPEMVSLTVEARGAGPDDVGPLGVPGFSPAGRAAADADHIAQGAFSAAWASSSAMEAEEAEESVAAAAAAADPAFLPTDAWPTAVDGTSQTYTSYIANFLSAMQAQYPHKWVGKLSFRNNDKDWICSATAISGNNIVTAAHCLYDTSTRNVWHTNIVFRPAYRNGSSPYGAFTATGCTVLAGFINLSGAYSYDAWGRWDVGVCTVGANSAGQTLNQAVGFAGRAWDYPYVRNIVTLGYPSSNTSNEALTGAGQYLRLCAAESFLQSIEVRGMGCNWGGGMSGGPWLDSTSLLSPLNYGTNGYAPGRISGSVTGVNSGITLNRQNLYAGRFTSSNIVPLCVTRGC